MRTLAEHPWVAVAFTLVLAVALRHTVVRRRRARAVATRWLVEHDYRIRRLSLSWWSLRAYRLGPAVPDTERGSTGSSGPPREGAQLELLRRVAGGTHLDR